MIVGKQKSLDEIWNSVKGIGKLLVFGCNTCVAVCHEGGNKEAEILASLLRMQATQENVSIEIRSSGIKRQCVHEFFDTAEKEIEYACQLVVDRLEALGKLDDFVKKPTIGKD